MGPQRRFFGTRLDSNKQQLDEAQLLPSIEISIRDKIFSGIQGSLMSRVDDENASGLLKSGLNYCLGSHGIDMREVGRG